MADEEINGDTDDIQHDKAQKKTAKHDSGVADLEKVTDYAEEKEISSQDISGALSLIGDRRNKEAAERLEKEKELQKVLVKKDDIELIVREMEISRTIAERTLREHRGDVVAALTTLTN
ncbi:Huntingtin-interacting protein K [Eumeta japonica]|uniref:Huntingtin-interacting protein K n=1 Tax=Eumeta variegata TaxID=151549 RepID=A0A4C1X4X2_EUMVA|nr:Huntingtin-interacting protein K [Eumeta japonica]